MRVRVLTGGSRDMRYAWMGSRGSSVGRAEQVEVQPQGRFGLWREERTTPQNLPSQQMHDARRLARVPAAPEPAVNAASSLFSEAVSRGFKIEV